MLTSCYRQAFYFSPFNANATVYHTTPLQVDSVKAATYAGMIFGGGETNDDLHDDVFLFRPSIYRGYARDNCQFYYGGNITLGNYYVKKYDTSSTYTGDRLNAKIINQHAGNKFFGGVGLNAGINYTIQFRKRHELRIGTESSYHHEFGDYFKFRKQLPDSAATLIHRKKHFFTLGLYTELAFKFREGSIGFKVSVGTPLGREYNTLDGIDYNFFDFPFLYISPAFQYTNKRWTGFIQINGGEHAFHGLIGTSYRLNYKTKK